MKLFQKKEKKYPYDPALQKPVIYSSICTGEKRAGFLWNKDGRFEEVVCIRSPRDMEMFYTAEMYIDHLQNILRLLTLYENFNVFIAPDEAEGYSLYCNEENGVMILKEDDPPILFEVTESNMVSAFWDYLNQTIQYRQFHSYARTAAIQQIRELIDALSSGESTIKTREDA